MSRLSGLLKVIESDRLIYDLLLVIHGKTTGLSRSVSEIYRIFVEFFLISCV